MLLSAFQYRRPTSVAMALDDLAVLGDDSSVYAGGTELLLAMKARVLSYTHLIDLKHIPELDGIRQQGDDIVIGARVSHFRLASDPLVCRLIPAYAALSDNIANIRVRVAGTLGGNLCFAEPHADPPALLALLGASVTLQSIEGTRHVPVSDFIEAEFTTVREANEILTEIRIPVPSADASFCYRSFGHLERPAVGIAAGFRSLNGRHSYGVWAGAIAGRPTHLTTLEQALAGVPPRDLADVLPTACVAAAEALPAQTDLHGSADYKQHLAAVFMRRAVMQAAGVPVGNGVSH